MQYKYPMIDLGKTGEWLRYLCKRNRFSVSDIQDKLKIASNQAIYSWFNGRTLPSLNNLYALSELIGVSMNDMIVDNVNRHPFYRCETPHVKRLLIYSYKIKQT